MTAPKLTAAQILLLHAVAEGKVDRLGSCAYYADLDGRPRRQVTEQARTLDEAGLINPLGVAMKSGKPMSPEQQFPDYYLVTLTPEGRHALADAAAGDKRFVAAPRDASCYNRPDVRSPKVFHVADAGEWFSTGQPLAGHLGAITLTALCSGALLDETLMYRSLAEVPEGARCRRRACANHWPAPQTSTIP